MKLELTAFQKIVKYECHENFPVAAELFRARGRADMTQLAVAI